MKFGGFSLTLGAAAALSLLIAGASLNVSAGPNDDVDGDGVKNLVDNCIDVSNPNSADQDNQSGPLDSDRDGFGNSCDGDFNQNGSVNTQDFAVFSAAYNTAYPGSVAYVDNVDMNSNGSINTQDFALFSASYAHGVPGPSSWGCAKVSPTAPNMTFTRPCEWLKTYRVKCQAGSTYGAGVIISTVTGTQLRFISHGLYRPKGAGANFGHCG